MDLQEFLDTSAGNWFAQRSSYNLVDEKCENNKAEISIEKLSPTDPQIIKLCEASSLEPQSNCGGIKTSWDNSVDWGQPKEKGYSLLVFFPDENNPQTGRILLSNGKSGENVILGKYAIAEDESLTLIIEKEDGLMEERQWFASPNLRLRSSLCKIASDYTVTSFYSEIRRIVAQK